MSRSMEITIDNILEGRLLVPGGRFEFDDEDEFGENASRTPDEASTSSSASEASTTSANSSMDNDYEVERNSNIFGNQYDLLRDDRLVQLFVFFWTIR